MSLKLFLDDAAHLLFGGVGIEIAVKPEKPSRNKARKTSGKAGDGIDDLTEASPGGGVDDRAWITEGEFIEPLDDLAKKAGLLGGTQMPGKSQQLMFEGNWDHRGDMGG
jgi:hypothetical protein